MVPSSAGFKWRSRREFVDWLTSMLSKQTTQGNWWKTPRCDSEESNGSPEFSSNGFPAQRAQATEESRLPVNLRVQIWEITWSGASWMCGKQLKHYPSFCVVIATDKPEAEDLQIYIPGENLCLSVHRKDIRISRDWVGDCWVDIDPNPEILSLVSSDVNPEAKVSMSSTLAKDAKAKPIAMPDIVEEADILDISLVDDGNKEVVGLGSNQTNTVEDHKEDDVNGNDEKARKSETVFTLSKTTTTLLTSLQKKKKEVILGLTWLVLRRDE
ncbi:agenet domain-containing protein / bromo-adjacent homology (BAH) domain-containing protein [Raphanus sativus]|nr:agenet domain-containing protein / bromo-adjacent homology (BAH) domain-containing protein [Raphanus sativus]